MTDYPTYSKHDDDGNYNGVILVTDGEGNELTPNPDGTYTLTVTGDDLEAQRKLEFRRWQVRELELERRYAALCDAVDLMMDHDDFEPDASEEFRDLYRRVLALTADSPGPDPRIAALESELAAYREGNPPTLVPGEYVSRKNFEDAAAIIAGLKGEIEEMVTALVCVAIKARFALDSIDANEYATLREIEAIAEVAWKTYRARQDGVIGD